MDAEDDGSFACTVAQGTLAEIMNMSKPYYLAGRITVKDLDEAGFHTIVSGFMVGGSAGVVSAFPVAVPAVSDPFRLFVVRESHDSDVVVKYRTELDEMDRDVAVAVAPEPESMTPSHIPSGRTARAVYLENFDAYMAAFRAREAQRW